MNNISCGQKGHGFETISDLADVVSGDHSAMRASIVMAMGYVDRVRLAFAFPGVVSVSGSNGNGLRSLFRRRPESSQCLGPGLRRDDGPPFRKAKYLPSHN